MDIKLDNINKVFGNYKALDQVSFEIEKGKLIGLLGPSGSGKTTILRILAGLERQDTGNVYLNGILVNELSASRRGIGFVFQSYGLFPYMTVYDNIAYGLKVQKKSKEYIRERVTELLELVELPGLEKRYPSELSGGQMQRIAFARALAPNPKLLLLDEPFAAIDAKVRKELRSWLREMITKIGITSIFVTHDQDEAVEVADEIIITNKGQVEQIGTPIEIYKNPRTPFVAQFIGQSTQINEYRNLKGFETLEEGFRAVIRPEFIKVYKYGTKEEYISALEDGIVRNTIFRGDCMEVTLEVKGNFLKTLRSLDDEGVVPGEKVQLHILRFYLFDDKKAYSVTNKSLDAADTFYI